MLLKKIAFSLMRLITILALAFVASSAMAGEFGVSLDMTGDISDAAGLQLQNAATIALTIKFDAAVVLSSRRIFGSVTMIKIRCLSFYISMHAT